MQKKLLAMVAAGCVTCMLECALAEPQVPGGAAGSRGGMEIVVVDESNQPLAGVRVSLAGHRSTTGKDGSSKFEVAAGRYAVLIHKEGYRGRRVSVGVRPGEKTSEKVKLQKLSPARPPRK